MPIPRIPQKLQEESLLTAAGVLAHRRSLGAGPTGEPPRGVVLCLQGESLGHAVRAYRGKSQKGFFGDYYLLGGTDGRVGVIGNFGLGAPVAAVLLEDMVAFGVRQFAAVGVAGGVAESLGSGDLVVAESAIRDEGTSHHYLPSGQNVGSASTLADRVCAKLQARGQSFRIGTSWTTDAPYRETAGEVQAYQRVGVLTVEMEAAAIYAVAHRLGVEACAMFCVGDLLTGGQWRPNRDPAAVTRGLKRLIDAAVAALDVEG